MTTSNKTNTEGSWLVVEGSPGLTIAPAATPLSRLNYFDGKFLRAHDLSFEQDAQRSLVQLSNQAGGFGIVHGFDSCIIAGDKLEVGPGMAIDAEGRVLLLPMKIAVGVAELISHSTQTSAANKAKQANKVKKAKGELVECELVAELAPDQVVVGTKLWLIVIAHAEFLCGEEDVYGKLCEQACVSSTERPFRIEGVTLRALPLELDSPLPSSDSIVLGAQHLRSQVASAYYADERKDPPSLINGAGLHSNAWCLGAKLATGEVALGVLAREGKTTLWFDAWTARRERMQTPPRNYWAQRMAMRPWQAYLAQILQFQCQLVGLLAGIVDGGGLGADPCADEKEALDEARTAVGQLLEQWTAAAIDTAGELGAMTHKQLSELSIKLAEALGGAGDKPALAGSRVLIEGGVVELPPAGYLPVDPNASVNVADQVRALLGEGVDLRFCVVRPDDVPRELEGAQHMDRISLLAGLDNPGAKPPVDILVPDGEVDFGTKLGVAGVRTAQIRLDWEDDNPDPCDAAPPLEFQGTARVTSKLDELSFVFAGLSSKHGEKAGGCGSTHALWLEFRCERTLADIELGVPIPVRVEMICCERQGSRRIEATVTADERGDLLHGHIEARQRGFALVTEPSPSHYQFRLNPGGPIELEAGRKLPKRDHYVVVERHNGGSEAHWQTLEPGQPAWQLDISLAKAAEAFAPIALEEDGVALAQPTPQSIHAHALDALSLLALIRCDPDLVERGLAKLFPEADQTDYTTVVAKLPWVLFRARSRRECPTRTARPPWLGVLANALHHLIGCRDACSVVVTPSDDLAAVFAELGSRDISICFAPGVYRLDQTLVLAAKRQGQQAIKLTGAGPATRLLLPQSADNEGKERETVLALRGFGSVSIRDMAFEGGVSREPQLGQPRHEQHLHGAVQLLDCEDVVVERVRASCVGGPARERTCLTIVGENKQPRVQVRACDFRVGARQLGLLVVNSGHATIRDNQVRVMGDGFTDLWLHDSRANARVRAALVRDILPFVDLNFGSRKERMEFAKKIVQPTGFATPPDILTLGLAQPLGAWTKQLRSSPAVGDRGIVVAGSELGPVWILDNRVEGFEQGIHVGVSVSDPTRVNWRSSQQVMISGNLVQGGASTDSVQRLHGIFVGNHKGCEVHNNRVISPLFSSQQTQARTFFAIICFGRFQGPLLVAQNQIRNGTIRVEPLQGSFGDQILEPNLFG